MYVYQHVHPSQQPTPLPVEGVKHLNCYEDRQSHGHGLGVGEDLTVDANEVGFVLSEALAVMGLWKQQGGQVGGQGVRGSGIVVQRDEEGGSPERGARQYGS